MEINSVPLEENESLHRAVIKHKIKEESNVRVRLVLSLVPHAQLSACRSIAKPVRRDGLVETVLPSF